MEIRQCLSRSSSYWQFILEDRVLANVVMDHSHQVDGIVFFTENASANRRIKEICAHHVRHFVRSRSIPSFGGMLVLERRHPNLTDEMSHALMRDPTVDADIMALDDGALHEMLRQIVHLTIARHPNLFAMLTAVVDTIRAKTGIAVEPEYEGVLPWGHCHAIRFTAHGGVPFRFWKTGDEKDRGDSRRLHVTPAYHPVMTASPMAFMVNGDTDTVIRGREIGLPRIFCPEASRVQDTNLFGTSWRTIHPFLAEGPTFLTHLDPTRAVSAEGEEAVERLLLAALGQSDKHVGISGGFHCPYTYPSNLLKGKVPGGRSEVRGSEGSCVWEYLTLKKEGRLDGAKVPSWFLSEGWLRRYADEVSAFTPDLAPFLP